MSKAEPGRVWLAALVALSLVAAACSGSHDPTASDAPGDSAKVTDDGSGKGQAKNGKKNNKSGKANKKGGKGTSGGGSGGGAGSGSGSRGSGSGGSGSTTTVDPSLANAVSVVTETSPDATRGGVTPDWIEVKSASITGLGEDVELRVVFSGQVPQKMPDDDTFSVIGFGLKASEETSFSFGAQAATDGWRAFAGRSFDKSKRANKFPGTFRIDGTDVVMVVPWSYLKGPLAFDWSVNAAWFATVGATNHYAYDPVPNDGKKAHFPQ